MDCIFCKIISKDIPAKILYEDEDTISFLDAFPVTKGHTLVIPKQHFPQIQDMSSNTNEKLFETVHPCLVSKNTYIGNVNGVMNAVITEGKPVGNSILQGEGAGPGPTSSSLLDTVL